MPYTTPKTYTVTLPSYSVGVNCYQNVARVVRRFGKTAVVIGGKTAMEKSKDKLLAALENSPVQVLGFLWYGGNSTYENVQALLANPMVQQADMLFGVGGGRAVDTCKVVADRLDKPLFTFPTIASNCAACTAISVMYNADDTFRDYFYPQEPPVHTFIDTQIIAQAPEDLFWAGIGDALSKECEVLLATRKAELLHTPLLGAQLSRACTNPLVEFGAQALKDCQENAPTFALQEVALDIIVSTGLVSNLTSEKDGYYYNSSLAHAVYYGATMVPRCAHKHLHGEIVSFGVLCLLTYDGQLKERERLARFNKSVGLPVCLKDLDLTPQDLPVMAQKAATVTEWGCVPYPMDKQRFIDAILECDQFGQNL